MVTLLMTKPLPQLSTLPTVHANPPPEPDDELLDELELEELLELLDEELLLDDDELLLELLDDELDELLDDELLDDELPVPQYVVAPESESHRLTPIQL